MADQSFGNTGWKRLSRLTLAVACISMVGTNSPSSHAQGSNGVTVNMGVLDDLDPMKTMPRLLMPSAQPSRGRIVLTPPAGVTAINPQRSRITLRPPAGSTPLVSTATTMPVPTPAAAAAAPPIPVTAPPPPQDPPNSLVEEATEVAAQETPLVAPAPTQSTTPIGPVERAAVTAVSATEEDAPTETELAALPSAEEFEGPTSIRFGAEETELPSNAAADLTELADRMKENEDIRVQLLAYASSADGSASSVRRKSLSRALSVREFLMDEGIQSTRIEVRALGDQSEGGNPDRVDAVIDRR